MSLSYRHLHLVGATGSKLRTAVFNDVEHLVCPVVAMVEGVVWAINAEIPEFVPAEELAITPQQWNGRAAFAGHPVEGNEQVTANTPRKLEESFGVIFDTVSSERILQTRRLEFEVWFDVAKAEKVGPAATDVLRRLRAGERVEVSVGCYIESEQVDGEYNGKQYHGIWRNIVSDHIAFLEAGQEGACSVAAGCGAPRAATRHLVTAQGITREESMAEPKKVENRGVLARLLGLYRDAKAEPGVSDKDLRRALDAALRAVEPGYMGIDEVFPADNIVIYSANPEDEWKTLRRSYTMDGDKVKLAKAEQVEAVITYEPIKAAAGVGPVAAPTTACGCKDKTPAGTLTGATAMKESVKKLIEGSAGKYTEADATWLEQVPEERLAALAPAATPAPAPTTAAAGNEQPPAPKSPDTGTQTPPAPTPPTNPGAVRTIPEAEYNTLMALASKQKAAEAVRGNELRASLKTAQKEYTEAELAAMPVEQLERMARMLGTVDDLVGGDDEGVDFSLANRGPRAAEAHESELPDPYKAALEQRRQKSVN